MGRPLVANRTSWVVSVDRTMLGKMTDAPAGGPARPGRRRRRRPAPATLRASLVTCGEDGSGGRHLLERLALPAGPGRHRRQAGSRAADPRAARGLPGHPGRAAERARLPGAVRRQPRPRARLPQPDHRGGVRPGHRRTATQSVNGASSVGRAGVEKQYDRWLRGMPGYKSVAVDSMGRVLGDDSEVAGQPGDTLVTTHRRQGPGRRREAARRDHRDRARDPRHRHPPQLRRRLRRRRRDGGRHRPDRRDGQPADVRPRASGSAASPRSSWPRLYSDAGRQPAARPRDAGPVRAGLDVEADHDRRRAQQRLHPGHPARLLLGAPGRQPGFKNYESGVLRLHRLRPGARALLQHLLLPGRATPSGSSYGSDPPTSTPRTRWSTEAKNFGFGSETGIDLPGEASGRIADRQWKRDYWKSMKGYYCKHRRRAAGRRHQRLRLPRSPTSSASRATTTAPATP